MQVLLIFATVTTAYVSNDLPQHRNRPTIRLKFNKSVMEENDETDFSEEQGYDRQIWRSCDQDDALEGR